MNPKLDELRAAIEQFVGSTEDEQVIVAQAVVLYEIVGFDGDQPWRKVSYTVPTDNFSLTGVLGLVEAGKYFLRRDSLGCEGDHD